MDELNDQSPLIWEGSKYPHANLDDYGTVPHKALDSSRLSKSTDNVLFSEPDDDHVFGFNSYEGLKLSEPGLNIQDDLAFSGFDHLLLNKPDENSSGVPAAESHTSWKLDISGISEEVKNEAGRRDKYSSRADVINKGILRMVKSFYQDLLFKSFPKYKTKRLWRVNKDKLLSDIRSLLKFFQNRTHWDSKLSEYIFFALRPNDVSFVTCDEEIQKDVQVYFDWIAKYTHK